MTPLTAKPTFMVRNTNDQANPPVAAIVVDAAADAVADAVVCAAEREAECLTAGARNE